MKRRRGREGERQGERQGDSGVNWFLKDYNVKDINKIIPVR